jgi:hypothetical protein
VNVETKEQPKRWKHTHSPDKPKQFKQTSARKLMATVFWDRQEKSIDGGIHATRDHNNATNVLRNTKKNCVGPSKKMRGMLTAGVVLLQDNARPHTAACIRALLEHFNWDLFDHPLYKPDLPPSDYHLFTYLKNWLRSQPFNSNELMEGVKTWLNSQATDFFDTGI